eukprot:scaffold208580_cov16-Tisochrysis_lutea.AAC.2
MKKYNFAWATAFAFAAAGGNAVPRADGDGLHTRECCAAAVHEPKHHRLNISYSCNLSAKLVIVKSRVIKLAMNRNFFKMHTVEPG